MKVKELSFYSYRNLADGRITPCDGVNIFFGDNAQGKTNLLEAIWMCTGARSFRFAKDAELVKFTESEAKLSLDIDSGERRQNITFRLSNSEHTKKIFLNGIACDAARISEAFSAVVFAPQHLSVIKDGPAERRRFIDTALCQLRPGCIKLINEYSRALMQRNVILRDYSITENAGEMLDIFEDALCKSGSELAYQRFMYTKNLNGYSSVYYDGLSSGKENMSVMYSVPDAEDREQYSKLLLQALKQNRSQDIRAGFTSSGPHRHDLTVLINDRPARVYGSQGQQRSAALSLKLAEAAVLEKISGSRPVALLDDVMSELDIHRQRYILNRLEGFQVFITSCDPEPMKNISDGTFFSIKNGVISNVSFDGR